MRRLGGAAAAAATVMVLLTGCGSLAAPSTATPSLTVAPSAAGTAPSTTPEPADTATARPTASSTAAPSGLAPSGDAPSAAASTASDAGAGAPADQCPDDSIGVMVTEADGGGGAGNEQFLVLFTNTGGSTCVLSGTPSVSVVGGAGGPRLGPAARRIVSGAKSLRLAVGESVAAPLQIVDIGTDGGPLTGCRVVHGAGFRVTAPHSAKAVFFQDARASACADGPVFMTVSPVIRFTD